MYPNQIRSGSSQSGAADSDLTGSNPRNDMPPVGLNSTTTADASQQRIPSPGITGTTNQNQIEARVWTRTGPNPSGDDPTSRTQLTRPISPTPLAQTREQEAEIASMVATLVDKSRSQELSYRTIADRLEQTKKELAEHQANAQAGIQSDLLTRTPTSRNDGAFGTPDYPSSRSARYQGEGSQQPL
ncbi:hypothetical protein Bca4012_026657 [Brassica carinata]